MWRINQFYSLDPLFGFTHKDGAQASYGIGLQVGQQLLESGLEGLVPNAILAGLVDALEGNMPSVPVETLHKALREIHERADAVRVERQAALAEEGQKFLDENQKRDGVSTTESGLQFSVVSHLVQTAYAFTIQAV